MNIETFIYLINIVKTVFKRIYVAYNSFFLLGLIFSMQIPFVGFQPIQGNNKLSLS